MVKIKIIAIGKDKDKWISVGIEHYKKLISRFADVELITISSLKNSSSVNLKNIKSNESELILKNIQGKPYIALSDKGLQYDSMNFSKKLDDLTRKLQSRVIFVIGGAYGLNENILEKADSIISLSKLTFSHQLVRLVLLEQIYRGFSISHNTDYHK